MNKQVLAAFLRGTLIAGLWTTVLTAGLRTMIARAEPGDGNTPTGASVDTSFLPKLWAVKPLLSPLFTDHLVLQRDRQDPIWGWAAPGAKVTVSINGKSATGTAGADGKWMAKLPALAAGGPYDLTVSGPATATLHDILIGDVWICSGQSNMEFGVGMLAEPAPVFAAANYPNLRNFTTAQKTAFTPQDLTTGHWDAVTPETIAAQGAWTFSAVGYFFGRELNQKLNVPDRSHPNVLGRDYRGSVDQRESIE